MPEPAPRRPNRDRDHWRTLANHLFLVHVRTRLLPEPNAWGSHSTAREHSTRIAVQHKNQFANLMSELPELPDAADIRDRWQAAMREAEADIAAYLATRPEPGELALA